MLITIGAYKKACRKLEKNGFTRAEKTLCDIDEKTTLVAVVYHPDGSKAVYTKPKQRSYQ